MQDIRWVERVRELLNPVSFCSDMLSVRLTRSVGISGLKSDIDQRDEEQNLVDLLIRVSGWWEAVTY